MPSAPRMILVPMIQTNVSHATTAIAHHPAWCVAPSTIARTAPMPMMAVKIACTHQGAIAIRAGIPGNAIAVVSCSS